MKLLEIKNNLVKLSYNEIDNPILGRFIVLANKEKSYVAQFVNLKSDSVNNFAIAKLLFTFTPEGIVDNYDGSIPPIESELSELSSTELLNLLPIETPIQIGKLAQQDSMLSIDVSVFERNLTVFTEKNEQKAIFISNCIRQLFQMKEKSVIVDTCNMFEDYNKIKLGRDFKLPLNSTMIDYLFEHELEDVNAETKAVIQDIFYAVQQYLKSLDFEFLPIDNFVDVVSNQYKELQMPELALLKNKLIRYKDANVFANNKEEFLTLKDKLNEKNCSIIDLKDIPDTLQKEVLLIIHSLLESFDKYVYFFVSINDENSDKRLLRQFINNNHVFTTFFASSTYKYTTELKENAQNLVLFTPQNLNNEFCAYNTFLNKLNQDECIVWGKLTQDIPFIVELGDLDLALTQEDVLGEKYQFVPKVENLQLVKIGENGEQIPVETGNIESPELNITESQTQESNLEESLQPELEPQDIQLNDVPSIEEDTINEQLVAQEEPAALNEDNELSENSLDLEDINNSESDESFDNIIEEELQDSELNIPPNSTEELLPEISEGISEEVEPEILEDTPEASITEDDLDFLEDNQIADPNDFFNLEGEDEEKSQQDYSLSEPEQTPMVPVYPADESPEPSSSDSFKAGDSVTHPRYGRGIVEKIIKYGNKTLCSISFENVGRRLLDPTISELTRI